METTNCWLQIEGWIFCLRCSLSGDMWTYWDFLWCLHFTSHLSALILYSKSDSPNIDTLTRVYYIHLVKWTKFFRKPVKKLPKYAQISSLSLQYKLKWSMMKDFSSENNWTNFAVSVRKTLHVIDLLSILTTLTWSSTFPLDFAILFKLWIFVVKQRNWLKNLFTGQSAVGMSLSFVRSWTICCFHGNLPEEWQLDPNYPSPGSRLPQSSGNY